MWSRDFKGFSENDSGSVYRGHFQSTTLTPLPPAPLLFLLEAAPSILQNAVRHVSRLLQLLHFTCGLVGLSTSSHALFQIEPLSLLPSPWRANKILCGFPGL